MACGGPDQPCCANRACNGDGCCVRDGNDDVCLAPGETCSLQGQGNGGTCAAGRCSGCGQVNQACCNGDVCYGAGVACLAGRCNACGGLNQTACPGQTCAAAGCVNGEFDCIAPGTDCGQNAGVCGAGGSCSKPGSACGGLGETCCGIGEQPAGVFCSQPGTTCTGLALNRRCVACGGFNQPCCDNDGAGGSCRVGTCRTGGGLGRTCR